MAMPSWEQLENYGREHPFVVGVLVGVVCLLILLRVIRAIRVSHAKKRLAELNAKSSFPSRPRREREPEMKGYSPWTGDDLDDWDETMLDEEAALAQALNADPGLEDDF